MRGFGGGLSESPARPLCTQCNKNLALQRKKRNGEIGYRKVCYRCSRDPNTLKANDLVKRSRLRPWILYKKDHCEECLFVAIHPVQLAVDHIDGNNSNNDPSNYRTLCHNCHTLKTFLNREHIPIQYRD